MKISDIARETGYSAVRIRQLAPKIPKHSTTPGGHHRFRRCKNLTRWIEEQRNDLSIKRQRGIDKKMIVRRRQKAASLGLDRFQTGVYVRTGKLRSAKWIAKVSGRNSGLRGPFLEDVIEDFEKWQRREFPGGIATLSPNQLEYFLELLRPIAAAYQQARELVTIRKNLGRTTAPDDAAAGSGQTGSRVS